jgi:hypothetical protein
MAVGYEQPSDLVRRSQEMINQAVGRGTTLLADRVEHYTNVASDVSQVLRDRGEPQAADLVQTLAQRAVDVARYLRNHDGNQLWSDMQEFGRDKTWLLAGAGFFGGLAAARAVRSAAGPAIWETKPGYVDSYASPSSMRGEQEGGPYERS